MVWRRFKEGCSVRVLHPQVRPAGSAQLHQRRFDCWVQGGLCRLQLMLQQAHKG